MSKKKATNARIVRDPRILMGKPCIAGTRISVQLVLEHLAYHSAEEVMESFPDLSREDIQAALLYAANEVGTRLVLEASAAEK